MNELRIDFPRQMRLSSRARTCLMIADSSHVQKGRIRSEFVTFTNRAGLKLAGCIDAIPELRGPSRWAIVAPKYGETKKNNLQLAYHLAANGLKVLRFDQSNHVGESEGRMQDFTLPGAVDDLIGCLDYLERVHGVNKSVLISNSLSARCALRAAARDHRVSKLISIAGVVNMQATLREVYREDIFGTYLAGRHWGLTDILGFDINGEIFLGTAVEAAMHNLAGTAADVNRLKVPVVYFYGLKDAWIDQSDIEQTLGRYPGCRLVPVAGAMHEVRENPQAAEEVFRQVVWASQYDTPCPEDAAARLATPDLKLVLAQNKEERARMKLAGTPAEPEVDFWSGYLGKYSVLEKSDDYRAYIELLGRICVFRPGALVLDAGCGNGIFGLWVVREAVRQRRVTTARNLPSMYVALDLTERGLRDAMGHHGSALRRAESGALAQGLPGTAYAQFDFDDLVRSDGAVRLPFADETFDVVCCSLVLSYLKQPQTLLAEFRRVARPGAVVVLTSMKPHCDMSVIYRDYMDQQVTGPEVEAARDLLRAAGKIRLKEEIGHYAFFSAEDLAELATEAGFKVRESFHSLGDQAVVIKTQK